MEELNQQDAIVEAIKKIVRENKQADFDTVREGLKQVGFSEMDVLYSMAEIDYQLSPWCKGLNKLSRFKEDMKARFASKHLKRSKEEIEDREYGELQKPTLGTPEREFREQIIKTSKEFELMHGYKKFMKEVARAEQSLKKSQAQVDLPNDFEKPLDREM